MTDSESVSADIHGGEAHEGWKSRLVRRLGAGHIAGQTLGEALEICRQERGAGNRTTVGFWNKETDAPEEVAQRYCEAVTGIAGAGLDCYLSMKAPAIDYDRDLLRPVLRAASAGRVGVHFDSLAPDTVEPTLAMLEWALPHHDRMSFTLPAGWRRSHHDLEQLVAWGVPVRIVKGQWADPAGRVRDIRAAFLALVEAAAGRVPEVWIATHDRRLAGPALEILDSHGGEGTLEQLLGLPRVADASTSRVPRRLYVPYGEAYLPYAATQALRRPAMVGWMLRDLVGLRSGTARRTPA